MKVYDIKPIKNQHDLAEAVAFLESVGDKKYNKKFTDKIETVITLVMAYEKEHFPIPPPTQAGMLRFHMEQRGLTQKNLIPEFGYQSVVSDVLNGKRKMTLAQVKKVCKRFNISPELFFECSDAEKPIEFEGSSSNEVALLGKLRDEIKEIKSDLNAISTAFETLRNQMEKLVKLATKKTLTAETKRPSRAQAVTPHKKSSGERSV